MSNVKLSKEAFERHNKSFNDTLQAAIRNLIMILLFEKDEDISVKFLVDVKHMSQKALKMESYLPETLLNRELDISK